jgi:transketolase
MSWKDLVGPDGECVSLEHFGASAPYQILFEKFGFTPDNVVAAAHAALSHIGAIQGSTTGN